MNIATALLVVESNDSDFLEVESTVRACGLLNKLIRFFEGEALVEFLQTAHGHRPPEENAYLIILATQYKLDDIRRSLQQIKKDEKLREIAVIVLANIADPLLLHDRAGFRSVILTKPLRQEGLRSALKKLNLKPPVTSTGSSTN